MGAAGAVRVVTTLSAPNPGPGSNTGARAGSVVKASAAEASARALRELVTTPAFLVSAGVLLVAFVVFFRDWFGRQNEYSLKMIQDWGHAYAVPLISGYLLFQRRERLLAARARVFWPGLIPIVLGLVCYFFFIVAVGNHMFQGFSMILALFGIVLFLLGPEVVRPAFMPISYLVFGVTIAEKVMLYITFPLQLIAAQGAAIMLSLCGKAMGFNVDVNGSTLSIDTFVGAPHNLDVAEACSGMRMVIAFVALAAAVALTQCKEWWQRAAVVLLSVPVAVFMNVLRVAVLGLVSVTINRELATGDAHMIIGTLLLVPGLGLFLLIVWALNKIVKHDETPTEPATRLLFAPGWSAMARPAFVVVLGALVVSSLGMHRAVSQYRIHLKKLPIYAADNRMVRDIPAKTASWTRVGIDDKTSVEMEESLGTKNHVSRVYVREGAPGTKPLWLQFHAAYYTGMVDTVPHVPERCMVGGGQKLLRTWGETPLPMDTSGWQPDPSPPETLPDALRGKLFTVPLRNEVGAVVKQVRLPRDPGSLKLMVSEFQSPKGDRSMSGYFFIANGGHVASAQDVRLLSFKLQDSYAYYLKVQFTSGSAATAEEFAAQAASLLNELLPDIMRCVPDWVEVENGSYPADNPARAGKPAGGSVGSPGGG